MDYRGNKLFAAVLVAACLGVLQLARSEARGRPEVDTTRSPCAVISKESLQSIPTTRQGVLELASAATLSTKVGPRGRPKQVTFEANGLNITAPVKKSDPDCNLTATKSNVVFPSGHKAQVMLDVHIQPELSVSAHFTNIRKDRQYFPSEVWEFTTQPGTSGPPPGAVPVPQPPGPGTPEGGPESNDCKLAGSVEVGYEKGDDPYNHWPHLKLPSKANLEIRITPRPDGTKQALLLMMEPKFTFQPAVVNEKSCSFSAQGQGSIAGYSNVQAEVQIERPPTLSDIPVLKWMFRVGTNGTLPNGDILVFITPRIVRE